MIHSILMIGQSNMAGRGEPREVDPIKNSALKVLRNGRWQAMYSPVNCDRPFSGLSLAESFADEYSKAHPSVEVGLIPCADGGTSIDQWKEGSLLFDHAIYQVRLAARTSNLVGIIWHQGESDCSPSRYPVYAEKLTALIKSFRKEKELSDIPFVLGALGDFLPHRGGYLVNYTEINKSLIAVAHSVDKVGYVSADGLTDKGDNLHFCSEALREFGIRYYKEFDALEDKERIFIEKPREDGAIRTDMELL